MGGGSGMSEFNKKAFINVSDFSSIHLMLEFVKYLDSDDSAYLAMLKEPLILDSNHAKKYDKNLSNFLDNIFGIDIKNAYRRGFGQWRLNIENRYKKFQKNRNIANKIIRILKLKF